jgi:Response regulator containing CheY-like receiver, AAA-type ATPase, and DNA-binding domains
MARILVVDDEQVLLDGCEATLKETGHNVETALSTEEALDKIGIGKYDVIVTDLKLPGLSGMDFLKILNDREPETDTIMITGYSWMWLHQAILNGTARRTINFDICTE